MRRTLAIFVLGCLATFAFVFGNEADEFPLTDLAVLLGALAAILAVQSGAILLADRLLGRLGLGADRPIVVRLIAAAFAGANAYFTALITLDAPFEIQAALSLAWAAILYAAMNVARWQGFALFVLAAYFVLSLGLYGFTRLRMAGDTYAATDAPRVTSRRNVYLIGNESLQSPKAYRELYGLDELPHVDFLQRRGFRVLDAAYSSDVETLPSYSRMLEFGRSLDADEIRRRRVFRSANSTFAAFGRSGYRTQFIYQTGYFAIDPNLVDYVYPRGSAFLCGFVPRTFFYGLCARDSRLAINQHLFGISRTLDMKLVADRLRAAARDDAPWLTIYHHAFPFHSDAWHSFDDAEQVAAFRARTRAAAGRVLEEGMAQVVDTIQAEDPGAVVILFGDHGAMMTRDADLDAPEAPLTSEAILEDRYGVLLAVYPAGFCARRIFEGMSTARLVENVIRCLDGDDAPGAAELAQSRIVHWGGEPRDLARYRRFEPGAR